LGAISLPTLSRRLISLIDWLAVVSFTLFGVVVWAYWLALTTGSPPRMAYRASQIAAGYIPGVSWLAVGLALAATMGWLALVRWRVSRQPPMIWRAVVLASGGLVLAWCLLMTLWLPVFNERNTYRDVGVAIGKQVGERCVQTRQLGLAERASIGYFGGIRFASANHTQCPWLLIQDYGPIARLDKPDEPGWRWVGDVRRRTNADERFRLYQR
jgi:4-amino-4-deoxy-L-arabinose transferase-like glycosyltransferase